MHHDPGVAPAYELADAALEALPHVLRGETSGEQALLAADKLALWGRYFSNDNPLYAINNVVGAEACCSSASSGALRILELGGGMGSAADALLKALECTGRLGDISDYRFSELVMPFLRRGQRMLKERWGDTVPLSFSLLDMNKQLAEQGVTAESVDLVWAVNTLHVATDLEATLNDIHSSLAPGGVLVAGECIRPFDGQPLPPEFIFNLLDSFRNPKLDPRWRPQGGFLTPEQWSTVCCRAGFDEVALVPDIRVIRDVYPDFVVAAVVARKRR
jgi:SAM-dependent methyltransferase